MPYRGYYANSDLHIETTRDDAAGATKSPWAYSERCRGLGRAAPQDSIRPGDKSGSLRRREPADAPCSLEA